MSDNLSHDLHPNTRGHAEKKIVDVEICARADEKTNACF